MIVLRFLFCKCLTLVTATVLKLDIPPREQWCWQSTCPHVGYCGEVAYMSALLYYGNYVSQEVVRYADNPSCTASQKLSGDCQLLIGVNDITAAGNLKVKYTTSYGLSSTSFLSWIKSSLNLGYPVIAGFYKAGMNDPDYDHIMIIVGYENITATGVSTLYWNDFSQNQTTRVDAAKLFQSRNTCTNTTQPYCLPLSYNYGIRIEGNVDSNNESLRHVLKVSSWNEPDYSSEDQVSPKPAPINVSANLTISGVIQGKTYSVLRFDRYNDVPSSSFGSSSKIARRYCFTASVNGSYHFAIPDTLLSNESYFFRTVMNNSRTLMSTSPSNNPTRRPTLFTSKTPTRTPVARPTRKPSFFKSKKPTKRPVARPSRKPSFFKSKKPTKRPVARPTRKPSFFKSKKPTKRPVARPTRKPSFFKSKKPTKRPVTQPTHKPSALKSKQPTSKLKTTIQLDIPPREQWCWKSTCPHVGYCGEVAYMSALLYYGNYVSQEVVRYADNPSCTASQKLSGDCQLLIGVNDITAAGNLKVKYTTSYGLSSTSFLSWIKSSLNLGYPVIAGFYKAGMNDPDYDHIMIIVGYENITATGVSTLYWNDFSQNQTTRVDVAKLFQSRNTCTNTTQPYCLPLSYNYGIRIEGNVDSNNESLRHVLKVSSWNEPDYSSEDQVSPKPAPINVSANLTISGVIQGKTYSVLRFDRYNDVPSSSFGSSSKIARRYCFTASVNGSYHFAIPDTLLSNESYFFRTVMNNSCTPSF